MRSLIVRIFKTCFCYLKPAYSFLFPEPPCKSAFLFCICTQPNTTIVGNWCTTSFNFILFCTAGWYIINWMANLKSYRRDQQYKSSIQKTSLWNQNRNEVRPFWIRPVLLLLKKHRLICSRFHFRTQASFIINHKFFLWNEQPTL